MRVPGGSGFQISRTSAHEGGKVVCRTHSPPLPPGKYSWHSFLLEAESNPGPNTVISIVSMKTAVHVQLYDKRTSLRVT